MHRQSTSVVRGVQRQRNDEARMEWFTKQTSRHHQLATLQPSIQRIGHRARVLMDKMAMPLLTTGYTAKQQASAVIYNGILKIEEMLADLFSLHGSIPSSWIITHNPSTAHRVIS